MYPTLESINRFSAEVDDSRPFIPCEYSHAMGNSNGSLKDYFELFETRPGVQGGFIWEWVDHGLLLHRKKRMYSAEWALDVNESSAAADCHKPGGEWFWGIGGDFGEKNHDFNFCADGMVWPDRTPHPAMFEFKKLAQPVGVEWLKNGMLQITNKRDFTDLSDLAGRWELLADGVVVETGRLPVLKTGPGRREKIPIVLPVIENKTVHLNVIFQMVETSSAISGKTPWCDAGHEIAREQFELQTVNLQKIESLPLEVFVENDTVSVLLNGVAILTGLELNLWRACTDNDGIRGWNGQEGKPMGQWLAAGFQTLESRSCEVKKEQAAVSVKRVYAGFDPTKEITLIQRFLPGASGLYVENEFSFPEELPSLPRIGLKAILPSGFEELDWFGHGPHESYIDRVAGAPVGRYASTVTEQYVPYIMPQEHGNHVDTRWMSLSNTETLLRFTGKPGFGFSVSHLTADDLFGVIHTDQLKPRPETYLTIDLRQRGLGSGSCGPQTRPEYCIEPGVYRFDFFISATEKAEIL